MTSFITIFSVVKKNVYIIFKQHFNNNFKFMLIFITFEICEGVFNIPKKL